MVPHGVTSSRRSGTGRGHASRCAIPKPVPVERGGVSRQNLFTMTKRETGPDDLDEMSDEEQEALDSESAAHLDEAETTGDETAIAAALLRKKAIRSAINQRHYQKVGAARRRTQYAEFRKFIDAYKVESGCVDCGYAAHPAALDFDHRDPGEKLGTIARMFTYTDERLSAELSKCDVRCANCHRIKTFTEKQTGKQGAASWDLPGQAPDMRKSRKPSRWSQTTDP
jgi:hypothetical protein